MVLSGGVLVIASIVSTASPMVISMTSLRTLVVVVPMVVMTMTRGLLVVMVVLLMDRALMVVISVIVPFAGFWLASGC